MPGTRQLHLGAVLSANGHHNSGWRLPEAGLGHDFARYLDMVKTAERGKFDFVFFADHIAVWERGDTDTLSYSARMVAELEPLTLLAALAATTSRIGLVATASTSYMEPYNLARQFASIDHISNGRSGWNVVTSFMKEEALNFGTTKPIEHAARYTRAEEFLRVVKGLWDSWEDDAFVIDKAGGRFFDPAKMHYLNHVGPHYSVRGPLNVSRAPQGHPLIFQAGASEDGMNFAANHADVMFSSAVQLDKAKDFYARMKARVTRAGRSADAFKILPGLFVIVEETEAAARAKLAEMGNLVHPTVAYEMLKSLLGVDISKYPIDEPLPPLQLTDANQTMQQALVEMAHRERMTIRQLAHQVSATRGSFMFVGTPEQLADHIETWFVERGADGFNLLCPYFPGGLDKFVDMVVPILQKRGLFRTEYEGATLRDHFALPRPGNVRVARSMAS